MTVFLFWDFFLDWSYSGLMLIVTTAMSSFVQSPCGTWKKILFKFSQPLPSFLMSVDMCAIPFRAETLFYARLPIINLDINHYSLQKKLLWWVLRDTIFYTYKYMSLEDGIKLCSLCWIILIGSPGPMVYLATGFSSLLKVPVINSVLWSGPYIQAENGCLLP